MKGTFSWLATGTMAIDTGVSRPPNSTATFSWKISSRAATTPLAGLASSSRRTSSSLRPPSSAARGVDLVDGQGEAARDGFAGQRRLARQGGDQADLDGLGRESAKPDQAGSSGGQTGRADGAKSGGSGSWRTPGNRWG